MEALQRATDLQSPAVNDDELLIHGKLLRVLKRAFHGLDRDGRAHLQRDLLAGEGPEAGTGGGNCG